MTNDTNLVKLKVTNEKFKIEKLDEDEIKNLTPEEGEKYERELAEGRYEKVTKPIPEGFTLKWKSIYNADEQITLFNNKEWLTNSLKATPKPYWSGSFTNPYNTYRTDLEVKYLLQQLGKGTAGTDNNLKGVIKDLEKEIKKNPDNKDELEAILAKIQTPEWGEFFESYKITDSDQQKAWKESGFSVLRTSPKTLSEVERVIKNGWEDATEISDREIAEYESEGVKTQNINPLIVVKSELDKAHRIQKAINDITDKKDINPNFKESLIQDLENNKLPLNHSGTIRIARANKISDLRDKNDDLSNFRNEIKTKVLEGLEKYSKKEYKFNQIELDWHYFGRSWGQWGNENGETWADYISRIDKKGDDPKIGTETIEINILRTFSCFIINHFLTSKKLTNQERKDYLQEWVDDNKTDSWDIEVLSEKQLREKLKEMKIENLPDEIIPTTTSGGWEDTTPRKDWTDIHLDFTRELRKKWEEISLNWKQTKEWIDAGFEPEKHKLVGWLVNVQGAVEEAYKKPDWVMSNKKVEDLEKELKLWEKKEELAHYIRETLSQEAKKGYASYSLEVLFDQHIQKKGVLTGYSGWKSTISHITHQGDLEDSFQLEKVQAVLRRGLIEVIMIQILTSSQSKNDKKLLSEEFMFSHNYTISREVYNDDTTKWIELENKSIKEVLDELAVSNPETKISLEDKKAKLTEYFQEIIDEYDNSGLTIGKFETELNVFAKKQGHYHTIKDSWKEEIDQIEDDDENLNSGDLGDTRMTLLNAFAEFFIHAVINHETISDDEKKKLIREYMNKHKDQSEINVYESEKYKDVIINTHKLKIPTTPQPLEIYGENKS